MKHTHVPSWHRVLAPAVKKLPPLFIVLLTLLLPLGCARKEPGFIPNHTPPVSAVQAREDLQRFLRSWQATPYRSGGLSRKGIDCSGLVLIAYRDIFGRQLPRTAREQSRSGREVAISALQPGDLLYFRTGLFQDHVGIYWHDDMFIHASTSKGVMASSLSQPYWRKRISRASRIHDFSRPAITSSDYMSRNR